MADDTVKVSRSVLEAALVANTAALQALLEERQENASLAAQVGKLAETLERVQTAAGSRMLAGIRSQQERTRQAIAGNSGGERR